MWKNMCSYFFLKNMNEEQFKAFELVTQQRKNIFLTGPAGTGKSFTLKKIVEWFRGNGLKIGVCSSTGTSAVTINGTTLHSFLGIGLAKSSATHLAFKVRNRANVCAKLKALDVLVIDEISMISDELFDKISEFLGIVRNKKTKPFGGIQIILCGDMCQLPPVDGDYCFKARAWAELGIEVVPLTIMVRQDEDLEFQKILLEARFGNCSDKSIEKLRSLTNPNFGEVAPTILFSKNMNVDTINESEYQKIRIQGVKERVYPTMFSKHPDTLAWAESLKIPSETNLCVGAQVMLTVNLNVDEGFVNGSRGVVTDLLDEGVVVLFKNGDQVIIEPWTYIYESDDDKDSENKDSEKEKPLEIFARCIPLKLAYALTIHKSQSATLDSVVVSLGPSIFEYGQAYTALSRVRDMKSIKVVDVLKSSFQTHPDVLEFYKKYS